MTLSRQHHDSFVLRIWREPDDAGAGRAMLWRGWVQHVHSGDTVFVQDVPALLAFIESRAGRLSEDYLPAPRLK